MPCERAARPARTSRRRDGIVALIDERRATQPIRPVAQLIQPQARRKARRALLRQQANTVARRICDAVGLHPGGRRLAARSATGASTDLDAAIRLLHRAINNHVGRAEDTRSEWTIDEIDDAMAHLESIADAVETDVRNRLS